MRRNSLRNITVLFLILLAPFFIMAQKKEQKSSIQAAKKSRTVKLNFDDELVTGSTEKPDLTNLDTRKEFNYKKLIRVRENFINETEAGLDDFKGH
ncbi:hypothetical protein [Bdellovibrio bacteriovorus]|uniref:hypothetical protein n=1 Tax=Bdellovibrio bacteriovorus TaxID=959 RepID=UPI0035A65641